MTDLERRALLGEKPALEETVMKHKLEIRPITFNVACQFVSMHHRHHKPSVGCKFCIGVFDGERMVGCAVCGRPVSRHLDNGLTLEITRLCTDGTKNACSMLYGACCRVAKAMGYKKAITYILKSENGSSLRASNFKCEGEAGGPEWTGKRNTGKNGPHEMKTRWTRDLL